MKIAMISLYLPSESKQGVGYQAHYMANAFVRAGHRVTMISPCRATEGALYETHSVNAGESLRTFRFAWRLRSMKFDEFDIVHAHGDNYWLWALEIPHIRTMHGSCFAEMTKIRGFYEKLRMLILGVSEIIATAVADTTVCVSENTRRYYPWVRKVIVNGVDLEAFSPGSEKAREPTILFVGTYLNRKRGRMLMEVFADQVRNVIPNARLWMVCSDAPPADGVEVFGHVTTEKLTELYRRAWVFCLPSTYEGFGVPYIEAMASGTPVVATPNPGAREVLGNGVYGRLCEDDGLGKTLLELLQNASERERIANAGLARSRQFAWEKVVASYLGVYKEIGAN